MSHHATVAVIGAGQAGLSAAFHLTRKGFSNALVDPDAERTFVVFDREEAPGAAWLHRWEGLTMETVNGIFDLPGMHRPAIAAATPARVAIPQYFADYEEMMKLDIIRPVRVTRVEREKDHLLPFTLHVAVLSDEVSHGDVSNADTSRKREQVWTADAVINATGTYYNPVQPYYPGFETFQGKHLHARDYVSNEEFAGQTVAVVGGGISALQLLEEISRVADTRWYTRTKPLFRAGRFMPEVDGRNTIEKVIADTEAGEPVRSIVSYTGLHWTKAAKDAFDRGALHRLPMFSEITPTGVIDADGSEVKLDAIVWATGYRPELTHLEGLHLRNEKGGVTMQGPAVVDVPGLYLIGYGPSQSTVGANRAGREAVVALTRLINPGPGIHQHAAL